jgi:hypothetical protein
VILESKNVRFVYIYILKMHAETIISKNNRSYKLYALFLPLYIIF